MWGASFLELVLAGLGSDVALGLDVVRVLLDELDKGIDGALGVVLYGVGLVVSGEEVERGEALDLDGGVVLGGINLGDDDTGVSSEESTDLIPLGGELLAVAAPGGVEHDEDVLVVVDDNVIVGLADDDLDVAVVLRGGLLRADVGDKLTLGVLLDELGDVGRGQLLVGGEDVVLAHLAVLDGEAGGGGREAKGLGVLAPAVAVELGEDDLGLVVLGNGREGGGDLALLVVGVVDEEPREGEVLLDVLLEVLGADLADEGQGLALDEVNDGLGGDLAGERNLSLVEVAVQGDLAVSGTGEDAGVDVLAEGRASLLDLGGLGGVRGGVDDEAETGGGGLEGLESGGVGGDDVGRLGVLDHSLDDGIGLAGVLVLGGGAILVDELDGREALDAVGGAEVAVLSAVNLGDLVLASELLSGLVKLGRKGLAVAAPGGVELDEDGVVLLLLEEGIEVLSGEGSNLAVLEGRGDERSDSQDGHESNKETHSPDAINSEDEGRLNRAGNREKTSM